MNLNLTNIFKKKPGYYGSYSNWQEARMACTGYENELILDKVKNAVLAVKNGEALYERDSVIFHEYQCSWAVLSILLKAAIEGSNKLSVLDFGGSLGSSYFQFKHMIPANVEISWNIVEQENFVIEGKRTFEDQSLKFHAGISAVPDLKGINVLLLSSVLPYVEEPIKLLAELLALDIPYVVIDRTPCFENHSQLTRQIVPTYIYEASYPAWFLNKDELLRLLSQRYKVISIFDALGGEIKVGALKAKEIGMLCQLNV